MKFAVSLCLLLLAQLGLAQDYHQWSEQFGARASLLGGAAAAGLGDNATIYYNPASMAFVENPSLSFSMNAYRLRNLKLENALGDGLNLKENQLSSVPNLIAGVIDFEKQKKLRVGYAVLTRRSYASKFDYLHQEHYEILANAPGEELYVASYNVHQQLSEYWGGGGLSYQVADWLALGLAHYGIYRDVKYSNSLQMQVLPTNISASSLEVSSLSTNITFNYWNVKGVVKPSIAIEFDNFKGGVTLTTPSFNMLGKASVYRDLSYLNMDTVYGIDLTFVDRVDGAKVVHKEEGSLAMGMSWRIGKKAWIHFTHETFFAGKAYLLFNPERRPSIFPEDPNEASDETEMFGGQNFLAYQEKNKMIINAGLGFEVKVSEGLEIYTGIRTDWLTNAQPYFNYSTIGVEASKWNLYHISLGGVHTNKAGKKYTVGFEYGFTPRTEFYHIIDFTSPSMQNNLIGNGGVGAFAKQFSLKLIIEVVIDGGKDKRLVE